MRGIVAGWDGVDTVQGISGRNGKSRRRRDADIAVCTRTAGRGGCRHAGCGRLRQQRVPTRAPIIRPCSGGSFYVQSKVWNAKEALLDDLKRSGVGGGGAAAGGRATTAGGTGAPADDGRTAFAAAGTDTASGLAAGAGWPRAAFDAWPRGGGPAVEPALR